VLPAPLCGRQVKSALTVRKPDSSKSGPNEAVCVTLVGIPAMVGIGCCRKQSDSSADDMPPVKCF